jgi:hypothetical protein
LYVTGWESFGNILLRLAAEERFPLLHVASLKEFKALADRCRFVAATRNRETGTNDEFRIAQMTAPVKIENEEMQVAGRQ